VKAEALFAVVTAVAAPDPEAPLRWRSASQAPGKRVEALIAVAASFARIDLERALELAHGMHDSIRRAEALAAWWSPGAH